MTETIHASRAANGVIRSIEVGETAVDVIRATVSCELSRTTIRAEHAAEVLRLLARGDGCATLKGPDGQNLAIAVLACDSTVTLQRMRRHRADGVAVVLRGDEITALRTGLQRLAREAA